MQSERNMVILNQSQNWRQPWNVLYPFRQGTIRSSKFNLITSVKPTEFKWGPACDNIEGPFQPCASTHCDQSLCSSLYVLLKVLMLGRRTWKALISLCECKWFSWLNLLGILSLVIKFILIYHLQPFFFSKKLLFFLYFAVFYIIWVNQITSCVTSHCHSDKLL